MNYKLLDFKKQAKWTNTYTIELICFDHKDFISV